MLAPAGRKGKLASRRIGAAMAQDDEAALRAERLRDRIAAKGLTLAEFARRANLTRNVMYGLGKGRAPKPNEQARIDAVLELEDT